jgi:hypothetical protein
MIQNCRMPRIDVNCYESAVLKFQRVSKHQRILHILKAIILTS